MKDTTNTDEITLKELIVKLIEFKNEILRNWFWVILISLPLAGYMYYKANKTPTQYAAKLTFMIDEDKGGLSSMAGLLGQIGFGGMGSGGSSNPKKMLELMKTRKILEKALFNKVQINDRNDYLANQLIRNFESRDKWFHEPSKLFNFTFDHGDISTFTRLENSALKYLHKYLTGEFGIINLSLDELTGIMKMEVQTTGEDLSIHILDNVFNELSEYYFVKTVEKAEKNYLLIKSKTDSIFSLLSSKEYQLATFVDNNRGLITKKAKLTESRLHRDVQKLSIMYGELTKNLEIADFSYNLKKPVIQAIDKPIVPLLEVTPLPLRKGIIGLLIGIFISSFFIITKKIIIESLNMN